MKIPASAGIKSVKEPFRSAVSRFANWWYKEQDRQDTSAENKNGLLTHYTDAKGLEGMLRNEQLWLTSIFHLNDPTEITVGVEIAMQQLRRQSSNAPDDVIRFVKQLEGFLGEPGSGDYMLRSHGLYVASFSLDPDQLGQWRAYGDDGRGYALVIAESKLGLKGTNAKRSLLGYEPDLARVVYHRGTAIHRQRHVVKRGLEAFAPCVGSASLRDESDGKLFTGDMAFQMILAILWNSITTKDAAYAAEREKRLIWAGNVERNRNRIRVRVRGSSFAP